MEVETTEFTTLAVQTRTILFERPLIRSASIPATVAAGAGEEEKDRPRQFRQRPAKRVRGEESRTTARPRGAAGDGGKMFTVGAPSSAETGAGSARTR